MRFKFREEAQKVVDYLNSSQKLHAKFASFTRSDGESKFPNKERYKKQEREVHKKMSSDFKGAGKEVVRIRSGRNNPAGVGPSFVNVVNGVKSSKSSPLIKVTEYGRC